ncbi:MAG: hypothetical protein AAFR93_17435 [Pseudomonadota bacterium]
MVPVHRRRAPEQRPSPEGRSTFESYCVVLPMTALIVVVSVFLVTYRAAEDAANATVAPEMGMAFVLAGLGFVPAFLAGILPWLVGRHVLGALGLPKAMAAALSALPTVWSALWAFRATLAQGWVPLGGVQSLGFLERDLFWLAVLVGSIVAPLVAVWASGAERG